MASPDVNAEQIRYWDEVSGPRWVAAQEHMDAMIEDLGRAAMDRARVGLGERVIDVGCGCGATSLELPRRVGAQGSVLGVDVSGPMLARARERAQHAGLEQLRFLRSDAQTHAFAPEAQLVFSRFGVMFFEDPRAAFANLGRGLAPGGRLTFVCWQPLPREIRGWPAPWRW